MKISVKDVQRQYSTIKNHDHVIKDGIFYFKCGTCDVVQKTEVIDPGVIPTALVCPECQNVMKRTNDDLMPDEPVQYEWIRPSLKECLKLRKPSKRPILDWIMKGGLLMEKPHKNEA